jgi:hypothetical protein
MRFRNSHVDTFGGVRPAEAVKISLNVCQLD